MTIATTEGCPQAKLLIAVVAAILEKLPTLQESTALNTSGKLTGRACQALLPWLSPAVSGLQWPSRKHYTCVAEQPFKRQVCDKMKYSRELKNFQSTEITLLSTTASVLNFIRKTRPVTTLFPTCFIQVASACAFSRLADFMAWSAASCWASCAKNFLSSS